MKTDIVPDRGADLKQAGRTNSCQVELSFKQDDPEWDRFVINSIDPHHEQTSLWGRIQNLRGWNALRLFVRRGSSVIGGAQILERSVGRLGKVAYVSRGPLAHPDDALLRQQLVGAVKAAGKEREWSYLAVVLPYSGQAFISDLESCGFRIRPEALPPRTSMMSTVVLDLAPDLDAILARMTSTTRRHIRQGQRRGITIREGGENDIGAFEDLLAALCRRRGVTPNIPLGKTLLELWRVFESKGHLKLFLGEQEARPVAALLLFTMGPWARAWRVGWSGLHERARPNELLYWECIKWAKLHGYRFFDFFGFDARNARALMEGRKIPADEWCGASFFKFGFGGTVLPLYPAYCYFYNPVVRLLFDTVGRRLLDSKTIGRLVERAFAGAF